MAGLRFPTKIIKSGLRIEELEHLTEKKLTAILQAREKQLQYVQLSFDMVLPRISRQDNITDPFKSDGRCKQANEFYQESEVLFRIRSIHQEENNSIMSCMVYKDTTNIS